MDTATCFGMLEPRLLLSTSTIRLREVAGTGYTVVDLDDCNIRSNTDTVSNSYSSAIRDGTGTNYYRALLGIKDLSAELPKTDVNGGVIDIADADLHLFRYGGDSSDTVSVPAMTIDWPTDRAAR